MKMFIKFALFLTLFNFVNSYEYASWNFTEKKEKLRSRSDKGDFIMIIRYNAFFMSKINNLHSTYQSILANILWFIVLLSFLS